MTFLPVVGRELRVAARKRGTYRGRVFAAFVAIAIAGFWLPVYAAQFNTNQGKQLFDLLAALAFGYCLVAGAVLTSDSLSSEKREGTIGLLFLTDLRGYDIILGKLVSRSLNAFYSLLAVLPVMALAMLLGGVTGGEVGRTALFLLNTLFLSMAAGVFASALSRNDRRAMFATVCIVLLALFAPYALALLHAYVRWKVTGRAPAGFDELGPLVKISPVYTFGLLRRTWGGRWMAADFSHSIAAAHLLGWVLLGIASWVAPRVCRERVSGTLGARWLKFRNRWSYGAPAKRAAFRARLLDRNPFYWLAARDQIKARYVWFFLGALALLWCWAAWLMGSLFGREVSFALLWFCFFFLKIWLTSEVCARLVEDRTSGAFELILCTPMKIRELASGQSLALWRQFGKPVVALLGLTLLIVWLALRSHHYGTSESGIKLLFLTLVITLAADMVTLRWVGMWNAITMNQVNRASLDTSARVLFLPILLFVISAAVFGFALAALGIPQPSQGWLSAASLLWLFLSLATDLVLGIRARWLFLNHLREVAAQRFSGPVPKFQPYRELVRELRRSFLGQRISSGPSTAPLPLWKRWWLTCPALLVACGLIGFGLWKRSLQQRVERELAAMEALGEPVTFAGLRAWMPPVHPDENAGFHFQQGSMRLVGQRLGRPNTRSLEWPTTMDALPADALQSLSNVVAQNQVGLGLLHDAAKLPKSRFPVDWQQGTLGIPRSAAPWQALGSLFQTSAVLEFDGLLAIENGDAEATVRTIRTLLALARTMAEEPYSAAQTHRARIVNSAFKVLERALNRMAMPERELALLQGELLRAETATGPAFKRAFIGERCLEIEQWRTPNPFGSWGMPPNAWQRTLSDTLRFMADLLEVPNRTLLDYLELSKEIIARAEVIGSETMWPGLASSTQSQQSNNRRAQRYAELRNHWDEALLLQVELVANLRLARAAVATERFRVANDGRLPPQPKRLTPEFLPAWPMDPFQEAGLQFKPLDRGYLVYSIGRNRRDDGGNSFPFASVRGGPATKADLVFQVAR